MCLKPKSPQTRPATSTPYYTTDIPCLSFARVHESSQPPPGQIPTTSPVCSISLLDVLTTCIIDNACVWTNITSGALDRLFPNRWRQWLQPTKEALDSATHHPLQIIGKLVKAKLGLGTIELEHDVQVVEDRQPRFLVGNDLLYDRVTIHESRFITVRCSKNGVAREIVPIQYGAPLMFGVLTEDITIKPSSGMRVQVEVQIDSRAANRTDDDYVNRLQGQDISLENIRYGPDAGPDCPIEVEEVVCTLAKTNKALLNIVNPTFTKINLRKGTRLARVSPLERRGAYFAQTHTPQLLSDMFNEAGENIELICENDQACERGNCSSNSIPQGVRDDENKGVNRIPAPQALYLHSHDEDIKNLMEGAEDGEMPLPPGYELPEISPDRKEYHISDLKTPYLTEAQRSMVLAVCNRHKGAFAQHDKDVGCCRYEEHDLDVGDSAPVAQAYRPCPRAYVDEATKIIENMLELGIIEESDSEFGQNLVIVKKPTGALRLCVDLRPINALLVPSSKPAWPIPHVEESFEKFSTAEFVSKLDLTNAYWCLKLTPRSRKVTAFYFLNRLYQFRRAPFGAANLPSVFARVMCKMLRGMRSFSWSFFDDIAVMSTDFESHLVHLDKVLQRIEEAGFKIRADKCRICVPKSQPLDWLGHIVCNGQLLCDPKKVKAIEDTPEPKNVDEVIKYVSALNFMSRHYPWFAQVVIPLYNMKVKANKGERFHFGEVEREAFLLSKQMAVHAPALELPRYDAELIISSDASTEAAAGMLSMRVTDPDTGEIKEVACGFVSRRFTEAERKRKSVPECEMTALIFTITAFSYYLVGRPSFVVRTDASSLLYLHKFKESNPRLMRAALWLQEYSFTIEHMKNIPGNTMAMADFMSRAYQHAPMVTLSWNNLRNKVFNQLSPPPSWPKKPLNKTEFSKFADLFFESFQPEFPEETEPIEKLKIQYFLNPSKERQKELDNFKKEQLKGRQKEKYLVIREKLRSIAGSSDQTSKSCDYNVGTENVEPPSEGRSKISFSQDAEQLSISDESSQHLDSQGEESLQSSSDESDEAKSTLETSSESENNWDELTTWDGNDFGNQLTNMLLLTTARQVTPEDQDNNMTNELQDTIEDNNYNRPLCLCNQQTVQSTENSATEENTRKLSSVPGQGLNTPAEMAARQRVDPELLVIIKKLQDSKSTKYTKSKYRFKEGVLTFQRKNKDGTVDWAVAIPLFMRKSLMRHVHGDGVGGPHMGSTLMFLSMRPHYYWPRMQEDIEAFCKGCLSCMYTRPSTVKQVGLKHRAKAPLIRPGQRLAVDLIVGLPRTKEGMQHIFTIIDEFSRYIMMIPCKSKRPEEMAKLFQERWIGIIGVPEAIHGDQGNELDSQMISKICQILAIRKSRTPSYSPQSNLAELANKTIGGLLKASVFPDKRATWWVQVLQYVVMAYNETPSSVTGFKPRELIFGSIPSFYKIPLVSFEHPVVTAHEFLLATRLGQEFLWQVVRAQEMRKRKPDEMPGKDHQYKEGDFVLVKDLTIGGPSENKLKPKYKGPFRILRAYPASLLIQKWITPKDRLNTGAILHHHTMNAKHFDARIVHPRDCKPYEKRNIGSEPRVHPKLISNFLKQLGQLPVPYEDDSPSESTDSTDGENVFLWDIVPTQPSNLDDKSVTTSETIVVPDIDTPIANIEITKETGRKIEHPSNENFDNEILQPYPTENENAGENDKSQIITLAEVHDGRISDTPETLGNPARDMIKDKMPSKGVAEEQSQELPNESHNILGGNNEGLTVDSESTQSSDAESPGLGLGSASTSGSSSNGNQEQTDSDDGQKVPTQNAEEQVNVTPPPQTAPEVPPTTRRQPPRISKIKYRSDFLPSVVKQLKMGSDEDSNELDSPRSQQEVETVEQLDETQLNISLEDNLEETAKQNTSTPCEGGSPESGWTRNRLENVTLETDLERTSKKNTSDSPDNDSPESGWTKNRLEMWVSDEIQPEITSAKTLITAHEAGEIEKKLSEAAQISGREPIIEMTETMQEQIADNPKPESDLSSGPKQSHHEYVNM